MYIQGVETARLFIKKGTEDVPDDGKYYLLRDDELIFSHLQLKIIQKKYNDILGTIDYDKPQIPPPKSSDFVNDVYASLPLDRKPFKKRGKTGSRRFG